MKLISFEGSDYSGKTTTSKLLSERLNKQNIIYNSGTLYKGKDYDVLIKKLNGCDKIIKEEIYTELFMLDKINLSFKDCRIVLQDRYWMSVVAYGRFLNGENSIHFKKDYSFYMVKPDVVIYLKCSIEEKKRRSIIRNSKSILDEYLLTSPENIILLENEIIRSIQDFDKIFSLDTTDLNIFDVADIVESYLHKEEFL